MRRTWGDKDRDLSLLNQIVQIPDEEIADWAKQVDEWRCAGLPQGAQESLSRVRANHTFSTRPLMLVRDATRGIMGALADAVPPKDNDLDLFNTLLQNGMRWETLVDGQGRPHMMWRAHDAQDYGLQAEVLSQLVNALQGPIDRFRRCSMCGGSPFLTVRSDQLYCSRRCNDRAFVRRKKSAPVNTKTSADIDKYQPIGVN